MSLAMLFAQVALYLLAFVVVLLFDLLQPLLVAGI
jgi:hypothetical protein